MDTALQKYGALLLVKASVDGLQSVDFKQVIFAKNELTKKQKSVNSQLFFDISKVFPVGGEYRDPSKITAARPS